MIDFTYKKYGLDVNAIWFCDGDPAHVENSRADIVFLHCVETCGFEQCICARQNTLITALTQPPEEIFKGFAHGYRRQIMKAQSEGVECRAYTSEEIKKDPSVLEEFESAYVNFVQAKGIQAFFNVRSVKSAVSSGAIVLTKASKDGVIFTQHVYVVDSTTARCNLSVSNFRDGDVDPAFAGRANKLLHWSDMLYFSAQGYLTYDWGGITNPESPSGVDAFKLGFGGVLRGYYNVAVGKSVAGKFAILARKMRREVFFS